MGAEAHILSWPDKTLAHHPIHGRDDAGVAKIDLGEIMGCLLPLESRLCLPLLALEDLDLLALLFELRPVEFECCLGSVFVIHRLLEELLRAGIYRHKILLAHPLEPVAREIGFCHPDRRFRLLDQGLLGERLLLNIVNRRLGGNDIRIGLAQLRPVIIVDHFHQKVTCLDPLEVLHGHATDITGTLCGQRCDIGLNVSIIRRLFRRGSYPPIPLASDENDKKNR
jgi:hypothetical protein